jgi:Kef-type K+ transport system membrane component KefB
MKLMFLILFGLGGLANMAQSKAVLPAYLVGMVVAPIFVSNQELQRRIRAIAFAFLTPFYFLKAGSLVEARSSARPDLSQRSSH